MTGLLRYPRERSVALSQNDEHMFAARHALVHYKSGAIYSFIPKNACSTLRYSLALANNCISGPEDWTWIHSNNGTFSASLADLVRAPFSFVILRCPYRRLASMFLDKFVDRTPELWNLYRLQDDGFSPNEFTFRAFVTMLDDEPTLMKKDIHWRPQIDFLVYQNYSQFIQFETLSSSISTLKDRIGLEVRDARQLTEHGTDRVELAEVGSYTDTPLFELMDMKRKGVLPAHEQLYDKALIKTVANLYEEDLDIYTNKFGPEQLAFKEPPVSKGKLT